MRARLLALAISAGSALAIFGALASQAAALPPSIDGESVSGITATSATLRAEINPNGLLTKYKLQIDTTGHFNFFQSDSCPLHPPGVVCAQVILPGDPLPAGLVEPPESSLPAGYGDQLVSVDLSSIGATLQPGTTYHYRAIAANSPTIVEGPDRTFTTPQSSGPPIVESESVSNITQTDATLEADINPNGLATSYQFRLAYGCGFEGEFCPQYCIAGQRCPGPWNSVIVVPLPSGSIPASTGARHVSLDLNSVGVTLEPYKYRYSVEATNSAGRASGPDQFFRPSSPPPPPEPPSIESEAASGITQTDATLEAEVNLRDAADGAYYQFQLVTDESEFASEILCPPTLQPAYTGCIGPQGSGALPIGFLPPNTLQPGAALHAQLDLADAGLTLQPDTTYHYRVLVAPAVQTEDTIEWEEPTVFGEGQTFTTLAPEPALSAQTHASANQPASGGAQPESGGRTTDDRVANPAAPSALRRRHRRARGPERVGSCNFKRGHHGLRHKRLRRRPRRHLRRAHRVCLWIAHAHALRR